MRRSRFERVNRPARLMWEQTLTALRAAASSTSMYFQSRFHRAGARRAAPTSRSFTICNTSGIPSTSAASICRPGTFSLDQREAISDADRRFGSDPRGFEALLSTSRTTRLLLLLSEWKRLSISMERSPEPFFLCVSTLHPHKNLDRLLHAFAAFGQSPTIGSFITGVRVSIRSRWSGRSVELDFSDSVELTGWIERAALYDLFRRATGMIYPSTFEGFGLPVVEAMAAGVPLACSDIEPLHSIVDGAAIEFAPDDVAAMTAAMHRLTAMTRLRMVQSGRERAESFTWDETARGRRSLLSKQVFELDLRVGLRVAILHDDRRVERDAPLLALARW